jgi:hydrogenase expression/formation protein HypC
MCLAIPGKVIETYEAGVVREACLEYVPDTKVGEYVLVHVGFAISTIDEQEAQRTYEALAELDQLGELDIPAVEATKVGGSSN